MKIATVEPWVEAPLQRFIDDARARLALLLLPSGQVVAQSGFARSIDVMSACALGAAIHASGGALGRQLDGQPFRELHNAGRQRQLYIAPVETLQGPYVFLAVFDSDSSIGLIRVFFEQLARDLASAAPSVRAPVGPVLGIDFELELRANLDILFRDAGTVHR